MNKIVIDMKIGKGLLNFINYIILLVLLMSIYKYIYLEIILSNNNLYVR